MFSYLIKRIALAIMTLLIITVVSYSLMRLAPGDPTKGTMFGEGQNASDGMSAEKGALKQNRSLREQLHLDEPILLGYGYWLRDLLLHGDLGLSAAVDKGRPVYDLIRERLPITVSLNVISILVIYLLAIPIGIYSAVHRGSHFDKGMTFLLFFLYSLPGFWVALVLQALLCEGGVISIFPLRGIAVSSSWGLTTWQVIADQARHYVLPVFCLSYAGLAGFSRYMRGGMLDVISQDYIRTARAKGLSEFSVIFKHALRNALIVMVTLFAGLLPGLVAGSIIIEHVFSIPGMGSLSMMALTSRDYPLLMTLFTFGGALTLGGILIADVAYVLVDPRITFNSRR